LTLRQAALIAGIAYLLMPVAFAEFYVFPKLMVPQNIEHNSLSASYLIARFGDDRCAIQRSLTRHPSGAFFKLAYFAAQFRGY